MLRIPDENDRDVLRQVLQGRSVPAIASDLGVSPPDVLQRFRELLQRLVKIQVPDPSKKTVPTKPGDDMPA